MPPTIAQRLGTALADRYVLDRELGAGGMATVWLARDVRHDRTVAIKVLRPELTAVLGAKRFLAEIRLTARLDHPHILTLIDSGEADGLLYYVLPYVRGESLRARIEREKQLPIDEAVRLVQQAASALGYAHANGVVHRDIKPENILLHEGEAVVTDFGIALALREAGGTRLTESGLSLGTPQYMSPEQATGDRELDARSDVYSLGAVLYELLSGDPPHAGATVQAVIAKLLAEKPTSLRTLRTTVPEALEAAVFKALSKVPADRFSGAAQFGNAIGAALTVPVRAAEPPRGKRSIAPLAAMMAVGALLGGTVAWFGEGDVAAGTADAAAPPVSIAATFNGDVIDFALAPDGQRLALGRLVCTDGGKCETVVEVRDVRGGISLPLTRLHASYNMRWSRDGRHVHVVGVDSVGRVGLFRVSALGGPVAYLGFYIASEPVGTTDSLMVAFPVGNGLILGTLIPGETAPRDSLELRASNEWSLSPDAAYIASVDQQGERPRVRLLDRKGKPLDSLTLSGPGGYTRFTADGEALLWITDGVGGVSIQRVAFDARRGRFDGEVTTVVGPFNMPQSFGGRRLDVADDGTIAYIAGVTPRVLQLLTRPRPGVLPTVARRIETQTGRMRAFISPDGRTIAFSRLVPTGGETEDQLVALDLVTGVEQVISPTLNGYIDVAWTQDSKALIYGWYEGGVGSQLVRWERSTGARQSVGTLRGRALDFFWALPDGALLTIGTDGQSIERIPVGKAVPEKPIPLPGGQNVRVLAPSADGATAATMSWTPKGDSLIIGSLELKTGQWREFMRMFAENTGTMRWLNDGTVEFTVTSAVSTSDLYQLDPRTGDVKRVGELPAAFATYNLSSDGRIMTAVERRVVSDVFLRRPAAGNAPARSR